MADAQFIRHPAKTGVSPPSAREPALRAGWGSEGASERPARLMQHVQTDEADVGALAAALGGIALVLIATAVIVILFAF